MKEKSFKNILFILGLFIFLLISFSPLLSEEESPLDQMIARILKQDALGGEKAEYLKKLTPLLFDYLKKISPKEKLEPLYEAQSVKELGQLIEKEWGKDIIEFGEEMFSSFEQDATKNRAIGSQWTFFPSEHFLFLARPGSVAESEIEFIQASAEGAFSAITTSLEIEKEVKRCLDILQINLPEKKAVSLAIPSQGKIVVYLHQTRNEESSKRIKKRSLGSTNFGATILGGEKEKGQGRLTNQIDVLYFNAFSLVVLHHEIAHAVLFLGSFDPGPLLEKPLKGESDLRKAFFAGYCPILPFLHEGIGDYVIYYQSFYKFWPVLGEPEEIIQTFFGKPSYIPLERLVKEDLAFSLQHHKEYSLEAASFLSYLLQTYGIPHLKKWLLSGKAGAVNAFERIYGTSVEEMEKRWLASLKEKSNF